MKLVLDSKTSILNKRFLKHLIGYFYYLIDINNLNKLKYIEEYLNKYIFTGKRKYTIDKVIIIILNNIVFNTDNKHAIIEIDQVAIFPYTTMRVADMANLIDKGNLSMKGCHIFHKLFKYVEKNISKLRTKYEMGKF